MTENALIIAGLNGSPHTNRNTATAMRWVLEGCEQAGAKIEWIHLAERDVRYCTGCWTCLRTGRCAVDDDVDEIIAQLLRANGVVVGSPVYEGQPTAQLSTLMDRVALRALYMGIFDKQLTFGVATSGIAPTKGVAQKAASGFGWTLGVLGVTTATLSGGFEPLTEELRPRVAMRARAAGRRFARAVAARAGKASPANLQMAWINFLRRTFLKRLITRNPDQFAGVLQEWKKKGWIEQ